MGQICQTRSQQQVLTMEANQYEESVPNEESIFPQRGILTSSHTMKATKHRSSSSTIDPINLNKLSESEQDENESPRLETEKPRYSFINQEYNNNQKPCIRIKHKSKSNTQSKRVSFSNFVQIHIPFDPNKLSSQT